LLLRVGLHLQVGQALQVLVEAFELPDQLRERVLVVARAHAREV